MTIVETAKKRQANFLFTINTIHLLKDHIPNKKQSEFVEGAVLKELRKKAFLKAIKKSAGAWSKHKEDTRTFIRSLRASKRI